MDNILVENYQNDTNEEIKQSMVEEWLNEAQYNEQRYDQLIGFADFYFSLGYQEFALMIYLRLHTIEPGNHIVYRIAKSYAHVYEFEEALKWFNLLPESGRTKEMIMEQVEWLLELNQQEVARELLTKLIQEEPTYGPPYFKLSTLHEISGDLTRAIYFVQAVYDYFSDNNDRSLARQQIVQLKLQQEQIDLIEIRELLLDDELPLQDSMDFFLLAKIYQLADDYDEAIKVSQKALELDPDNSSAGLLLVELSGNASGENFEESLQWFEDKIPESEMSPIEIAEIAESNQQLDLEMIQRLEGYFAYTSDTEEQYHIISLVLNYYIEKDDTQSFTAFLNNHALAYFTEEELGYFIGKMHFTKEEYEEAIVHFESALDYLVPEMDLVELLIKSLFNIRRNQDGKELAEKCENSDYYTAYIQEIIEGVKNEFK
ncbi:tetratricopeptide repeat protein [Aerococcaceae bacterium DSM 111022]|nr:tetratricopeptide repeat protein [Aerococcaceae bacterium DSM 111022]